MSDPLDDFTDEELARIAEREAKKRETVYPRWVAQGRISREEARFQLRGMRRIARDYRKKADANDLFGGQARP